MKESASRTSSILLIISSLLLVVPVRVAASDGGTLEISGRATTGPGGWDVTVFAQSNSNGVSGSISVLGGATGPVLQIVPPGENGCGCWCINARRTDVGLGAGDQRENVYIRDVGDGVTSFDQFSLVSGIGIDCSFPTDGLFFGQFRQGDFKTSQGNNTPPVATWIQPADDSVFPGGSSVVLTAQATDSDGTVSFVDFFAGATHVGRVPGPAADGVYNFTWSNPADGHYRLHAVAVDNAGGRGISGSVRIFVGDGNPNAIDLGTVEVSTIGFGSFGGGPGPIHTNMGGSTVAYLIDQDQSSGGGALLPAVSVNWDTNSQFLLTIAAPAGHKFVVQVPEGGVVGFDGFLWWESTRGGLSPQGTVTATFGGLEGTAPVFLGGTAVLADSHGFFGFAGLDTTRVAGDFAFTSLTLIGTVTPQHTGGGTESYVAHSHSSLQIYSTKAAEGPFVSIVPVEAPDVLTPAESVALMSVRIAESSHPSRVKRPLIQALTMCCERLDCGETDSAVEVLQAFQRKVALQISRRDPALARQLIASAQSIIDGLPAR